MIGALVVLLVLSAFFSIAETAMMAFNRYRLKHLVAHGDSGALRVAELLRRTDRLLGGILIGNTLVIAAASTLSSLVAVRFLGHDKLAYAIGTLVISFLIIVFAEVTPKVIGATFPERDHSEQECRGGRRPNGVVGRGFHPERTSHRQRETEQ